MTPNPMRAALLAGRPQIGTWLTPVRDPEIIALIPATGPDFARIDMEHTALTIGPADLPPARSTGRSAPRW